MQRSAKKKKMTVHLIESFQTRSPDEAHWGECYFEADMCHYLPKKGVGVNVLTPAISHWVQIDRFKSQAPDSRDKKHKHVILGCEKEIMDSRLRVSGEIRRVFLLHTLSGGVRLRDSRAESMQKRVQKYMRLLRQMNNWRMVFPSNDAMARYIELGGDYSDDVKQNFRVIPHGIDTEIYAPVKRNEQMRQVILGEEVTKDTIVVSAHIAADFRQRRLMKTLLKITERLQGKHPDIRFLAIGFLTTYNELVHRNDLLDLKSRGTTFIEDTTKKLTHSKIKDFNRKDVFFAVNASDIYLNLMPQHTFSYTVAEAMSCGLPVLTPKTTALPELVGDAGMYYEYDEGDMDKTLDSICEKLLFLAKDEKLRKKLGKKARKRIKDKFSIDRMINNYIKLFEED